MLPFFDTTAFQSIFFFLSVALLIYGSDMFVSKAEKIGLSLGISPLIIGVTVVAFGTSLPELGSSVASVLEGKSQIVAGNVIGSNISNILFVLGFVGIIAKDVILNPKLVQFDMMILITCTVLLYFCIIDGDLSLIEALLFIAGLCIFLYNTISGDVDKTAEKPSTSWIDFVLLVAGVAMIFLGAKYCIDSMSFLGGKLGIDESFIAITMLALGTSLPEVSVSATAAKRGNIDIAVGNILGSNIFNTLGVMSISSFFGKLIIPDSILSFGLPFMIAVTALFFIVCIGQKINRWSGLMLLLLYVFFIVELSKSIV